MKSDRSYLEQLSQRVILFDGAMGTSIQAYSLSAADYGGENHLGCIDQLSITQPEIIREIHDSFLAVGCDAIETNTFRANRLTLAEFGLGEQTIAINEAAARIARTAADQASRDSGVRRFVAGSMGPSGKLPSGDDPDLSDWGFEALAELFQEQAQGLMLGGVDLLLLETSQDILEVKAAIHGIQRCFAEIGRRLPLQVQITLDTSGRMLFGTDIYGALTTLVALPIDLIGLNCSTGPEHMREPVRFLLEHSPFPISVMPNAGLPLNVAGEAVYPMQPTPFAELVSAFAQQGVQVIGGCCGTTPEHLQALYQQVHGQRYSASQQNGHFYASPPRNASTLPSASSAMTAFAIQQEPRPTLIGERVNSQGSRRVKKLLLEEDYDSIVQIAVDQVARGAHMLDVCVALTERTDETEQMATLVKKLSSAVPAPLIIDTTEAEVAEAALAVYPGRSIINGNNLENGRERIDAVLPIAKKYGAAVLSMTIDEAGMAHTRERKLSIAQRITEIAVQDHGFTPQDLIFDPLTFPLTTGQAELREDAHETLEGIRLIKQEIPGAFTCLGISNVSFGVSQSARGVLNSVFLYHAVAAGLDMAIVNPAHITPYAEIPQHQRSLAEDLIFNRDPDALARFIQFYEENSFTLSHTEKLDPTADLSAEEALHWHILHRRKEGVEQLIDDCLLRQDAVGVLNHVLLPAMKDVGDRFGAGELILPFVLQSAEVMKRSVRHLEQFMERSEGTSKGTVVLATVFGDVHDIGKNLVKTILSNNGYEVRDLGKQVPVNTIIDNAVEIQADAIGLSALLVSTSKQMPLVIQELAARDLAIPVLVGGAAINRKFGQRILFLGEEMLPYSAGVFYCRDAFEGLAVMEQLMSEEGEAFVADNETKARETLARPKPAERTRQRVRSNGHFPAAPDIPQPPFWGVRVIHQMPLEMVLQHLHKPELFRLSWGAKNTRGAEWEQLETEFEERLLRMGRAAGRSGALLPQAVYGYFPANADGDELIIWDAELAADGGRRELARFSFPRQPDRQQLCLADYFTPVERGQWDTCVLQIVTVGEAASREVDRLQAADQYSEAYYFHGLAVQSAEATANYVTAHIRRELKLPENRGKRYSWGYPACPDLADHQRVWQLMPPAATELNIHLTEAHQIVPEASTAAIFAHHPQASYFSVGSLDRVAQILDSAR
ncbi:MAG: methionine synthase [Chloroflexi bacterium]|nr:methionine synthase [Chloroflexota bacterium]